MAKAKRRRDEPAPLPGSHLEAIHNAGFDVVRYQSKAIAVQCSDGSSRNEWLPCSLVNWGKKQIVEFFKAGDGNYSFDGWEPSNGHHFGGRYDNVQSALNWFVWLDAQSRKPLENERKELSL